jgi:digeranylgeranylglycerophospholipid reductase
MNRFDIAVIGGGIAGLSAACAVSDHKDLSIVLLEGNGIGSNDSVPLTFSKVTRDFDLADCCKEEYSNFTFHNYEGSSVKYRFRENELVVLAYAKACGKLFDKLKRTGRNIEFVPASVTNIIQDHDDVQVQLEGGRTIHAKIVIDASGRTQLSTHLMKREERPCYYSHVYGGLFSGLHSGVGKTCSFLLPNPAFGSGGGWFYSLGMGTASFGYATISTNPLEIGGALKDRFAQALKSFHPYSEYLKNAKLEHVDCGIIPITYARRLVNGRTIIVGDAGGMATNWTCMGIEPALKYGKVAGEVSARAIRQKEYHVLNDFDKLWKKENKAAYDWVNKRAEVFWFSDPYTWEWIIKNDLALLTPAQVLERMRNNKYLPKKRQVLFRAAKYKISSILDRNTLNPSIYTVGP